MSRRLLVTGARHGGGGEPDKGRGLWICLLPVLLAFTACSREAGRAEPDRSTSPRAGPSKSPASPGPLVLTPVTPSAPPVAAKPAPRPPKAAPAPPAAPGGPPAQPTVIAPPAPGTYLFDEAGLTRVRGCLSSDQAAPTPGRLKIYPSAGSRQRFERTQTDSLGAGAVTTAEAEYRNDGIYLVYLRQVQTTLLQSLPAEFEPAPPPLTVPSGPFPGQTWSFTITSKDGKIKVDTQNKVEGLNEPIALGGGKSVPAHRISTSSHITGQSTQGALDLTRNSTAWFSPEYRFGVKEITDVKGRVGLCEVESHLEATLRG